MELTTTTDLRAIADEAYGAACAAPDDYSRGYAAGVEDLARWLAGQDPSGLSDRLTAILSAAVSRPDRSRDSR